MSQANGAPGDAPVPDPATSPPPAARATPADPPPPSADDRAAVRAGVAYKGEPLDAARGPGLGCFWIQIVVLAIVVVLTPLSAAWEWPVPVTIVLLAITLVLLLFVGQTIIFLLRLVAADRRAPGRRRPMRSETKTVGEIEDESEAEIEAGSEGEPPGVRE